MKSVIKLLLIGLVIVVIPTQAKQVCQLDKSQQSRLSKVKIKSVYDGDTVRLQDGRKVRLIGINTPEMARDYRPEEPWAERAKQALLKWRGKTVWLQQGSQGQDRYGRVLGHLFSLSGDNITAKLLAQGLGFTVAIPPNLDYQDCYQRQAETARQQSVGVWREGYFSLRSAASAKELRGGYGRFRGKIKHIKISRKLIWVELFGDVSLRIDRRDQSYLDSTMWRQLLKAVDNRQVAQLPNIEFSGWLLDRTTWGKAMAKKVRKGQRKRWQMNIRHHSQWAFL